MHAPNGAARPVRRWPLVAVVAAACLIVLLVGRPGPANVESERDASNPPQPDVCTDPLSGVWAAQTLYRGDSYRLTMEIRREDSGNDALTGTISSHYWRGPSETPPVCAADGFETVIDMASTGSFVGNKVLFTGNDWKLRQQLCGEASTYVPDGFYGDFTEVDGKAWIDAEWYAVYDPIGKVDELFESERSVHVGDVRFRRVRCAVSPSDVDVPELPEPGPSDTASRCGCL
jgi:hypothetical protein